MTIDDAGTWWYVTPRDGRILVNHGVRTVDGGVGPMRGSVLVGFDAALELAVGIVHAALEVDADRAQAAMLALWVREARVD